MHVLRSLCGEGLGERLFELRRRVCSKASQTDKELEGRQLPRRLSGQHQGETPTNRSEGPHTICSRTQNYHAGETIAVPDPSKLDGLLLRKWRSCRSSCARRARLQMLPPSSLGITQGWGLMMSYCARLSHPPPTGTPRRAKNPVEGLPMLSSPLVKGVRGCPLLRASNEHCFTVRVLRARRAPGRSLLFFRGRALREHRRSTMPLFPSRQARSFISRGMAPVLVPLRPSSEALLRARVPGARNQHGCHSLTFSWQATTLHSVDPGHLRATDRLLPIDADCRDSTLPRW